MVLRRSFQACWMCAGWAASMGLGAKWCSPEVILDPDVDGGDFGDACGRRVRVLGAGDGGKAGDEVVPGVCVDGPGLEGSASLPVVDQLGGGLVEFASEGVECCFKGVWVGVHLGDAVDVACAGVDPALAFVRGVGGGDAEVSGGFAE